MGHVYVVNIRDGESNLEGATPYRVDRANPVLGNPFHLTRKGDPQERNRVLSLHRDHVMADLAHNGPISQELDTLARRVAQGECIALQCWCSPLPCHADLYAKIINERADALKEAWPHQAKENNGKRIPKPV